MSSNRKNKKNNKKKNHHVLNSYTMEALEPRLMMAADLGAALEEFSNQADFSSVLNSSLDQNLSSYTNCVC